MQSQALAGLYMPTFGAGDLQGPSGFYAFCGTAPNWTMSMHAFWCENESKRLFEGIVHRNVVIVLISVQISPS